MNDLFTRGHTGFQEHADLINASSSKMPAIIEMFETYDKDMPLKSREIMEEHRNFVNERTRHLEATGLGENGTEHTRSHWVPQQVMTR